MKSTSLSASIAHAAFLLAVSVIVSGGTRQDREPSAAGPDIVLIVMDTVRARNLSYHGYDRRTSANLDRLAEESYVLTNAISVGGNTPVTTAGVMTGRWPYHRFDSDWTAADWTERAWFGVRRLYRSKLIRSYKGALAFYDLEQDPKEKVNLPDGRELRSDAAEAVFDARCVLVEFIAKLRAGGQDDLAGREANASEATLERLRSPGLQVTRCASPRTGYRGLCS